MWEYLCFYTKKCNHVERNNYFLSIVTKNSDSTSLFFTSLGIFRDLLFKDNSLLFFLRFVRNLDSHWLEVFLLSLFLIHVQRLTSSTGFSWRGTPESGRLETKRSERGTTKREAEVYVRCGYGQVGCYRDFSWYLFSRTPAHTGIFTACYEVPISRHGYPHRFLSEVR